MDHGLWVIPKQNTSVLKYLSNKICLKNSLVLQYLFVEEQSRSLMMKRYDSMRSRYRRVLLLILSVDSMELQHCTSIAEVDSYQKINCSEAGSKLNLSVYS